MKTWMSACPAPVRTAAPVSRTRSPATTAAPAWTTLKATTVRNSRSRPANSFLVKMAAPAEKDPVSILV